MDLKLVHMIMYVSNVKGYTTKISHYQSNMLCFQAPGINWLIKRFAQPMQDGQRFVRTHQYTWCPSYIAFFTQS